MIRRHHLVSKLCAAALLVAFTVVVHRPASTMAADSPWSAAELVSHPGTIAVDPALASNDRGDVMAVWTREGAGPTVEAARFDPLADRWTAAVVLSPPGTMSWARPAVAVERDGDAIVVWEQWEATTRTVVARHYSASVDSWSGVVALDAPQQPWMASARPTVVVDPSGSAVAAWLTGSGSPSAVRAARFDVGSSSWSSPVTVSQASVLGSPVAVVDAEGDVTLAWFRLTSPQEWVCESIRLDGGSGTFGAMAELGRDPVSGMASGPSLDLGVGADGDVLALFDHPLTQGNAVRARWFDASTQTWGAPQDLTGVGIHATGADVAVSPSGDAVAVWRQYGGGFYLRSARFSASTGTWTTPIDVGTGDVGGLRGRVVLDADGVATVVWSEGSGTDLFTRTATSGTTGGWSVPETLDVFDDGAGLDAAQPRIALDAAGRATVAWRGQDGPTVALFAVRPASPAPDFVAVSPVRVFDTRPGESPEAVRSVPKVKVGGESVLQVAMTDLAGVVPSSGVGAVSLNVTVVNPAAAGYVTVYPCGARSLVSSVNFGAGATVANAVIAPVSDQGSVCFFSLVPTDLVVDLNGWFATG